jgi:hypothetical protein
MAAVMNETPLYESLMTVVSALSHSGYEPERDLIALVATSVRELEEKVIHGRSSLLPDCMMPDGAEPCLGYRQLDDQLMRWFKAASPYATPGSLEGGLDRLRACENALMDLYEANAKGVFSVPDKYYSLITAAAEVLKQDSLAVIAALRRKGWNSAIRRAAEVAEHYAGLMKSEAAQRVADEIRAMLSDGKS